MTVLEQLTSRPSADHEQRRAGDLAAREDLRAQVARLERELSHEIARGFPHISPSPAFQAGLGGPRLLTLSELERLRDSLVARLAEARAQAGERAEFERRSRLLLERMKLEPGRYKFVRLPVADLGERGCGAWHVRPRLGLIGMLAGWWQLKLSSGCPLARGRAVARPAPTQASSRACGAGDRSSIRSSCSPTSAPRRGTCDSASDPSGAGS